MAKEIHKKVWGSEEWLVNNEKYCSKFLNLKKGYQCSIHYHKNKDETFYVLSGKVLMELEGDAYIMQKNESVRVLPNKKHRFSGIENSVILEVSTHHEEGDSYRETESGKVDIENLLNKLNLSEAC
ncbi:MAG: cupin domain-containing protein [Candidatus Nanoarchaeia archaeon]